MKQSTLLSLLMLVCLPIFSMNDENKNREHNRCRCDIGKMFYSVAKHLGRNDYLYLANADSVWFLRKKLQLKESFGDRDKYYLRFGRFINKTNLSVCHTPLHEAISQGNVGIVKLLCSVGADMHKKIKTRPEVNSQDITTESHGSVCMQSECEEKRLDAEIKKFKSEYHVGKTALELAILMRTKAQDKIAQREEIERFLIDKNKKN